MSAFLENFPKKLSVSTRCDLGERVLTVKATPLGSREVRPPFIDCMFLRCFTPHHLHATF